MRRAENLAERLETNQKLSNAQRNPPSRLEARTKQLNNHPRLCI
jgi:hypothetical protein